MDVSAPRTAGQHEPAPPRTWRDEIEVALLAPIRAIRLAYLPLLMVYFAYGALGLISVAESFWIKSALSLTPTQLSAIAVWLTLPWAVKMVFGELVDTVPLLGSQRRAYVFLGAGLVMIALLLLAGAASGTLTFASADTLYVAASLLSVTGVVLQDVVADAMSTEVVARINPDGSPRPPQDIAHDLGMVQVLGRLALSLGIFSVAGVSGWLAQVYSTATVYLIALAVPLISVTGAALVHLETSERRPIDWTILGGGLAFGAVVSALALSGLPLSQEIVFVISMTVIIAMLVRVTREVDEATRQRIFFATVIIFAFRATPTVGEGYRWFSIDVLGFDESFYGVLQQVGAALALVAAWFLSDLITRKPVATVLLWLTVLGTLLSLPDLLLVFQLHHVTERLFGIGARSIALIDTAAQSPFAQLGMIPLLTLIAIYAPAGHRAIWFALMASLMNLALVAGSLQTKYLNMIFPVDRGAYENLPVLLITALCLAFIIPMVAIVLFGRRIR